jgi:cellulose synthase/poly-beta-1,6-N-acetylglucosamine synthase-like glycosyltransferase
MEKISILIPAYNEEKGIEKTIISCLNQTRKPDEIIVVNDGSTDRTLKILKKYLEKITIVNLEENTGNKSKAQEIGLKFVKGDIFITADADTRLHFRFVEMIEKSFRNKKVSAVCGHVISEKGNWITKVREINYISTQTIYKKAQSHIDAIFVLSGCCSAFRKKDFYEVITFDHDNVTEDLDFTYKLKLANKKIIYQEKAIVYTQDPNNIRSYMKQLKRWYSGGWACLKKNWKILKKSNNALVISLIYTEGLILGIVSLFLPILLLFSVKTFFILLFLEFLLTSLSISYGVVKQKEYYLFFYIPHYYLLHFLDNYVFITTFFKEIILNRRNLVWTKPDRY